MPRRLPPVAASLATSLNHSLALVDKAEAARVSLLQLRGGARLTELDVLSLYESAYLRMFVGWEDFLDRAFMYYLCGWSNSSGSENLVRGQVYARTLSEARLRVYGANGFALWHNPQKVMRRAAMHFSNGLIETVIASDLASIECFAALRHRIAHGHEDSRVKFDRATMVLSGRRFRAGRPGRFLRDLDAGAQNPRRWIQTIAATLDGLAHQIAP